MAVRGNSYFNNPGFAQAAANLGALFAPPSGADAAGWANANVINQKRDQLAQLFAAGSNPSEQAALIGVQNYGQTPQGFTYSVDQDTAAKRYGVDVGARTSIANNAANNDRALTEAIFRAATAPVSQNSIRPGFNPADYGRPDLPAVPQFSGSNSPLSETQWQAQQNERLRANGTISDQQLADVILGERSPVQAVGPDNKPVFLSPGAAIRTGAQPYISKGTEAKPVNYQTPEGQRGTATTGPMGKLIDTQTGADLPAGSVTFGTNLQGSESEAGLSTKSNMTAATGLEASLDAAEFTTNKMLDILSKNQNVAGIPGRVKGLAQSLVSSASQVANAYSQQAPDAVASLEELKSTLENSLGAGYDPNIVRVASGIYDLAYARAQIANPTGEVSRQAFERALQSFGQGFLSSQEDLSTALKAFAADTIETGRVKVNTLRGQRSLNSMGGREVLASPGGAAPASSGPAVGTVEDGYRFKGGNPADQNNWERVQ
jgi:hypothetical protein